MKESNIELALVNRAKKLLGFAIKMVIPSMRGMPDRMVLLPGGTVFFVELKAPGKKPSDLQLYRHEQLRALGFKVYVIDSKEGVDEILP